ncbi:MAG: hypothetical protein AAB427_00510, partial [Chloroflexota bacterium]
MSEAVRGRLHFVLGLFGVLIGLIVIRLISLQFGSTVAFFVNQNELASSYRVKFEPPRGRIFDRNGELLAGNDVQYELGLSPDFVTDPESLSKILSSVLNRSYEEIYALTQTTDKYVPVQRPVSAEIGEKLLGMQNDPLGPDLKGLSVEPLQMRVYPSGRLAANVLGFVGYDNKGYYGVEEFYNQILAGHSVVGVKQ